MSRSSRDFPYSGGAITADTGSDARQAEPGQLAIDPEVGRKLIEEFATITKLFARTHVGVATPQQGSFLAHDDRALEPYPLSVDALAALRTAADHLNALRLMIVDAHSLPTHAGFTLLRAALENAATAVWLLAPRERDERVRRAVWLRWSHAWDRERYGKLTNDQGRKPLDYRRTQLQSIARAQGLTPEVVTKITGRAIGYGQIVREAAESVAPVANATLLEPMWMVCSGIAHGRTWAQLDALDHVDLGPSQTGITRNVLESASEHNILAITKIATAMARQGWYLLATMSRRIPPA